MHFYKVSSNYSGVRMKRERDSNTKGLVVCGQDQTTVDNWQKGDVVLRRRIKPLWKGGEQKNLKFLEENLNSF